MRRRRLTYGAVIGLFGTIGAIALGVFADQDEFCGIGFLQPVASDVCGAVGLGHRPTRAERLAWEGRETGSCDALRLHINAFPDGAYRSGAADLLTARRVERTESWTPTERSLALFVRQTAGSHASEADAQAAAVLRGERQAESLCRGMTASDAYRLDSVRAEPEVWDCSSSGGGVECAFEGRAVCELEERRLVEAEVCEEAPGFRAGPETEGRPPRSDAAEVPR
ncbi:MAG: hypothetical protein ACR2GQ_06500 [Gemmatimonadota bacterium]